MIERAFGHKTHYLIAERAGVITGVLPLTHIRSALFGSALISNAFAVQGGPAAADDESRQALDSAAARLMDELRVATLEMRGFAAERSKWQTKSDLYATFRRPLQPSVEANLKAVPRKQRAMIRKGIQNGLRSEIDSDVDRLYRIYAESVRNLGTPVFGKSYFQILTEEFAGCCDIVTVMTRRSAGRLGIEFLFSR